MQQREHHAHDDRQHIGKRRVVIHKLRHERAGKQRAEESKAHRDRQREILERVQKSPHARGDQSAEEDHAVAHHAQRDRPVDIGQRRGQADGVA